MSDAKTRQIARFTAQKTVDAVFMIYVDFAPDLKIEVRENVHGLFYFVEVEGKTFSKPCAEVTLEQLAWQVAKMIAKLN